MSEETEVTTLAFWNGCTANNPCPDWWDEEFIKEIDGVIFHVYFSGGRKKQEVFDTLGEAVNACPWMDDDDLVEVAAAFS